MNDHDLLDPLAIANRLKENNMEELLPQLKKIHASSAKTVPKKEPRRKDPTPQSTSRRSIRSLSGVPVQSELRLLVNGTSTAGRFNVTNDLDEAVVPEFEIGTADGLTQAQWSLVKVSITPEGKRITPRQQAMFKIRVDLSEIDAEHIDIFEFPVDIRASNKMLFKLWVEIARA
jgi:hypothetical protein